MFENNFMNFSDLGKRIKELREKHLPGVSQNRAAMMALLTYTQLIKIENGHDFQLKTLYRMSERWNIPIEEFFCPEIKSKRDPQISKRAPVGK